MAAAAFVDAYNVSTGAVNTTTARSGYGFSPKAWIDVWSGRSESTETVGGGHTNFGISFGVSSSSRAAVVTQAEDATDFSDTDRGQRNDATCIELSTAGAVTGLEDISSVDGDGKTYIIDDQFVAALRKLSFNIGGADITNAAIVNFQDATSATTHDVTGFGFDPDVVFIFGIMLATDPPTVTTAASLCFGACDLNTLNQWMCGHRNRHNVDTGESNSYFRSGEILYSHNTAPDAAPIVVAAVTAKITDGFRLTYSVADTGAREQFALGIKGGSWKVGTLTTLTNTTTDIDVTGLAGTPRGGIYVSHCDDQSTADTPQNDVNMSFGAFSWDGATLTQGAHAVHSDDAATAAGSAIEGNGFSSDQVYLNQNENTSAMQGEMRVTAVGATSVTHRMTDADPAGAIVGYAVLADAPAASGIPIKYHHYKTLMAA